MIHDIFSKYNHNYLDAHQRVSRKKEIAFIYVVMLGASQSLGPLASSRCKQTSLHPSTSIIFISSIHQSNRRYIPSHRYFMLGLVSTIYTKSLSRYATFVMDNGHGHLYDESKR